MPSGKAILTDFSMRLVYMLRKFKKMFQKSDDPVETKIKSIINNADDLDNQVMIDLYRNKRETCTQNNPEGLHISINAVMNYLNKSNKGMIGDALEYGFNNGCGLEVLEPTAPNYPPNGLPENGFAATLGGGAAQCSGRRKSKRRRHTKRRSKKTKNPRKSKRRRHTRGKRR